MSNGGKGSRQRPLSVDPKTFKANWDKVFGKKAKDKSNVSVYNSTTTNKGKQ